MSEFKISAPGRIVLTGEHATMYEKHVVMASLDQYTTVKFSELIDGSREIIKIEFPDVALSLIVSLEQVVNFFSGNNSFDMTLDHCRLLRLVQSWITSNGMWSTQKQRFSLQTLFFLLFIIAYDEKLVIKSFHVHVSTQLPIGAGLGSSSSFAVCLAACFMHWACLQKGIHNEFNRMELSKISNLAMCYERIAQNYMFGADNDVCSYGKIIESRYKNHEDSYDIASIDMPTMKILLIDSNIRQNKSEQAKKLAELKHYRPEFVDFILNLIDSISKGFCSALNVIKNFQQCPILHPCQDFAYGLLQFFIQTNQYLLRLLNMSYQRMDIICSIANRCGFGGKLTGFGGRFVYILLPPSIPEERITNLSTQLVAEGFNFTMTSVSCSGVKIDD